MCVEPKNLARADTDLAITFVDWAPPPPDNNMGLWGDVTVTVSGAVQFDAPYVTTALQDDGSADLAVITDVVNVGQGDVSGLVACTMDGVAKQPALAKNVTVPANATLTVTFTSKDFPQLLVKSPQLWWPWQMGDPTLHTLSCTFTLQDGTVSDTLDIDVGWRQMGSYVDDQGHRVYTVNKKRIMVRGGGWAPDLLLRTTHTNAQRQLQYTQFMGLNAIRWGG